MIIHSIYINHFGKWSSLELQLSPHWTSIQGENESGKSTLNDFIIAMLFGFKKIAKKRTLSDDAGGYLIIECQGVQYKVERYRHQHRGRATVIKLPEHELVGYDEALASLIKVNEREAEAIYTLNALMVDSQQITEDEWQGYVLSYAVSGSDTLFQLEKEYQSALKPYYKKRGKPGLIQQAFQEKLEYENQISQLELEDAQRDFISDYDYERKIAEKVRLDDQIKAFDEYKQLKEKTKASLSAVMLSDIQQHLQHWQALEDQPTRHMNPETFQKLQHYYAQLKIAVKQYQSSLRRCQWLEEELKQWQDDLKKENYQFIGWIIGGLLLVISVAFGLFSHFALGFIFGLLGAICCVYHQTLAMFITKKIGYSDTRYDKRRLEKVMGTTVNHPSDVIAFMKDEQLKYDVTPYIQRFKPYMTVQGETLKEQLVSIRQGMRRAQNELSAQQGVSTVDTVEKIAEIKQNLQQYDGIDTTDIDSATHSFQQLQQQFQEQLEYKQRLHQLKTYFDEDSDALDKATLVHRRDKLEWELEQIKKQQKAQATQPTHSLQELYQLHSHVETKLYRYMQDYQMLQLKLNWLRDIKESTKMDQLPMILRRCSRYFRLLTQGRYDEVLFRQNQLVVQDHHQHLLSMTHLSTGTRSQLVIALRLAFISLQQDVTFPVMMDEGWVFFDHVRQQQLFELLGQYSRRHQLITFSNDDLTGRADKIIDLREEKSNVK